LQQEAIEAIRAALTAEVSSPRPVDGGTEAHLNQEGVLARFRRAIRGDVHQSFNQRE
jgi:hypothetical protein